MSGGAIAGHLAVVRNALVEEKARAKAVTKVSETAFLPAALEVIERPVSPTARLTGRVMLAGVALMAAWLAFGRVDIVATAPGKIIPSNNVQLVQPAEAGIVRQILVRDGQHVRKGQALVVLDPTVSTADTAQAQAALLAVELDGARARAILGALEGKGFAFTAPQGASAEVAATQSALAQAQLSEIQSSISGQSADRQAAAASYGEARAQAAKLIETLPLLDEQIAANEKLLEKGYVSKLRVVEMRRQRLAAARDRDMALQASARASAQMSSTGSGVARTAASARATVLADLVKAETDARLRREELVKSRQRSSLTRLVSPVDGTVARLAVHTIGGVVEPTRPIMVIVPEGSSLVAEVRILNKDIGFVQPGQEVAIKLDAFPFTRYGTVPGRIETISSDAVEDERLGLYYPARIRLDRATINRGDRTVPIGVGLSATADIRTGDRTLLSYLTSPIEEARLEAVRER